MRAFLKTVPWYEGRFRHVWLWREFPIPQKSAARTAVTDAAPRMEAVVVADQKIQNSNFTRRPPVTPSLLPT
jgi:hypothetical protein